MRSQRVTLHCIRFDFIISNFDTCMLCDGAVLSGAVGDEARVIRVVVEWTKAVS